jgi:anti-sigma factor RsiW
MPTVSHVLPSEPDQELLSAYVDGELTDRERAEVEQRLTHNPQLRAALDDLRQTVALVRSLPDLKAPRNFTLNPAMYGRKKSWWHFETRLEWVGMLGTAASIVLIMLGVLLSQNRTEQKDVTESGSDQAVAITNAQPTTLATLLTAPPTAIAYTGENIEATGLFQATYFGGTETAEAAAPMIAAAVMPTGTMWPAAESGQVDEGDGGVAPLAADAASTGAEEFSPDMTLNAYDAVPPGAPGLMASSSESPPDVYEGEAGLGAAAMPAPDTATMKQTTEAPSEVPAPVQAAGAFREASPTQTEEAEIVTQEDYAAPTMTTSAEVLNDLNATFAPTQVSQSSDEQRTAEKSEAKRDPWWLAGLGGVTLVVSILVLLAGRRKARA